MKIKSNSFNDKEKLNKKYSGHGDGISPQISWSDLPKDTKSLALFMHDPDAPIASGFWHGLMVNIPVGTTEITEGEWNGTKALHINNDTDNVDYYPPMPPKGTGVHNYNFTIYALPFEDLKEVMAKDGLTLDAKSSKAFTAFYVEMNKLDSATISGTDEFSEK